MWFVLSDAVLTQAGFIKDVSTGARPEGFCFRFLNLMLTMIGSLAFTEHTLVVMPRFGCR